MGKTTVTSNDMINRADIELLNESFFTFLSDSHYHV